MGKRKVLSESEIDQLVLPEKDQILGRVIQLLGYDRFRVKCADDIERICRVRGKMKRRTWIRDGDYVLELRDSTGWISVDGIASGGERSLACLVLRIAFALVLAPQLKWLVLDEPTHNLDSRTVEDLAKVLRDNINEYVEQVFLITHDSALEDAVSGYLYKFDRKKEKDGITEIAKVAGPDL